MSPIMQMTKPQGPSALSAPIMILNIASPAASSGKHFLVASSPRRNMGPFCAATVAQNVQTNSSGIQLQAYSCTAPPLPLVQGFCAAACCASCSSMPSSVTDWAMLMHCWFAAVRCSAAEGERGPGVWRCKACDLSCNPHWVPIVQLAYQGPVFSVCELCIRNG